MTPEQLHGIETMLVTFVVLGSAAWGLVVVSVKLENRKHLRQLNKQVAELPIEELAKCIKDGKIVPWMVTSRLSEYKGRVRSHQEVT